MQPSSYVAQYRKSEPCRLLTSPAMHGVMESRLDEGYLQNSQATIVIASMKNVGI